MDCQTVLYSAEKNVRLLNDLKDRFGAIGFGKISNFFEVSENWRCPCCQRSKPEFARLDKNGELLCELHRHHDHFGDEAMRLISRDCHFDGLRESFCRFPATLVCSDCNVAEPNAKNLVKAPSYFSFAPYEIAIFIDVRQGAGHEVDPAEAHRCFKAAIPAMQLLRERLNAIIDAQNNHVGDFKTVGFEAWHILKRANELRKLNAK